MFVMRNKFGLGQVCGSMATAVLLTALTASTAISAAAKTETKPDDHTAGHSSVDHYYEPLPQDTGTTGLKLMLRRLQTTGRLMQIDAHPDDEDGGMLTLESRGKGVSTLLMTLNRGEGGQNKLGSNLFDVLGVLRTLEVLAADRYYGVEQRFSRVADFGYSKTPEETFQKWQGHDIALADIVRVIRTFRPDVLVARFSGTDRDGHGHHQASAILTKEAFRAAADPNRFPEQIKEGLQPWQPKKLYIGNVCGFGASTCDPANYTVKLNTGQEDPLLGMSYVQFAVEGLRHQESQGLGDISLPKGDRFAYYKLVDSVVESPKDKDKDGHEQDFFDGIDTTLPGLASRLGDEEKKVPWLRGGLESIQKHIEEAAAASEKDPLLASDLLDSATGTLLKIIRNISPHLSPAAKDLLVFAFASELSMLQSAGQLARSMRLDVTVDGIGPDQDHAFVAVPGQTFRVTATATSKVPWKGTTRFRISGVPGDWKITNIDEHTSNGKAVAQFHVTVPNNVPYTRPYWHRANPETDAINAIDEVDCKQCLTSPRLPYVGDWWRSLTLPFSALPNLTGMAYLGEDGGTSAAWMVRYKDEQGNVVEMPLAVVPQFSVTLEPGEQVVSVNDGKELTVRVGVRASADGTPDGTLRLEPPAGWKSEPSELPVHLPKAGDKKDFNFKLFPGGLVEGRTEIRAVLEAGGKKYAEGYTLVTREDLGAAYYYQPALQRVSIVSVKVPKDLKVGYIMGAGDDIPTVLEQIGMNVTMIPADKLASEDLSKYQTIVLGIRAYDTQKDVIDNNKRLLEYVENGGRLVVQYNTMGSFGSPVDFNDGKYTPYPATLSRARVSVEEAPVQILDPTNPIFHSPNEITQKDFEGWVQERGLYFMSQWDSKFTPLLESHDPGEDEQKGGLLVAHYGKGIYIYTGYAFFRQLPAGVPGAVRLFVNLVGSR
jgi:LmbE family N-acetylglucosaminyl deacetylase